MRFMVIVKATAESEKEGALPDPQLMAEMGKYGCRSEFVGFPQRERLQSLRSWL